MDTNQLFAPHRVAPDGVGAAEVEAFLIDLFGSGIRDVTRIGHGEWAAAFAFRSSGADFVARFGAFPEDFAKDRLAARYAAPNLPIPAIAEIGRAFDCHYAISERAFGAYIDALDAAQMRATLPSLFAALDAARRADLSGSAGFGIWDGNGMAPHPTWRAALLDVAADRPGDRTCGWQERLAASTVGTGPFDEALEHLDTLVEFCPEERHLIHSDLLHFNVLVANDRIAAVLDWGCAMYGDFLYDLAWFAFWAPWYPAWRDIDFRREAARHFKSTGVDVPNFEERLRCYQIHIGLDSQKYKAFKGDWDELEVSARRTLAVAMGNG